MCRNCAYFAPGSHNDCREPAAERVVDKERANFCEYFMLDTARAATGRGERSADPRAALEALFRKV